MDINYDPERRPSRIRALERSLSYSEAIGNNSRRPSSIIEIPNIQNTDVYINEETKKQCRLSQTYVEGKEIAFPNIVTNVDTKEAIHEYNDAITTDSVYSSEDEHGLTMTIDVENNESPNNSDTKRTFSGVSTRPLTSSMSPNDPSLYDTIEVVTDNTNELYTDDDTLETSPRPRYAKPYSKRKKRSVHRRRRGRPTRSRRVVLKSGEENVPMRINIPSKSIKYLRDIVNTVINSKWRFLILLMVVSHFVFWLVFAGIWQVVSNSYRDDIGDEKDHCVTGTSSFAGLLMMSVETQMTIGYGVRYPKEECPEAIIVMVLEIVAGTALSGGFTSLLFTKLVRPNRHVSSVGFSKKATVCLRDGELTLQFRVWDLFNHHLIGSSITAYMLKPIRTLEGELVQNYIHQLKLKQAKAFLLWPITVVHVINAESPLYDFSAQDMMDYRFEIVVCLTGSSKNMGTVTQSRTSYLSKEIMWGYRLKNVLNYSKKKEAYVIDIDNLNTLEQVETPLCSASHLKTYEEDIKSSRNVLTPTTSVSPTNMSFIQDDSSTLSKPESSLHSVPSFNRNAITQRSLGWNYRRFAPEKTMQSFEIHGQEDTRI